MNQIFILFFVSFIFIMMGKIYQESINSNMTYQESSIDSREYLVRNNKDKKKAADLLATINQKSTLLIKKLVKKYPTNKKILRLQARYNPNNIAESTPDEKATSYSINKGEKIVFCIRSKDKKQKLENQNIVTFVAIHELAHLMTESIGHTPEFWNNFKFILKDAIKFNIYKNIDFKNDPKQYCGMEITNSPLDI